MNEEMKQAWLEISRMLGEPTREELDVFLRTWQRAMEAQKQPAQQEPVAKHYVDGGHLVYPPLQRPWVGLTDEEAFQICVDCGCLSEDWLTLLDAIEAKLKEKNT